MAEESGFDPWQKQSILLFSITSRPDLGAKQPATQWVNFFPGVKVAEA
jgi:hypothetical protein